MFAVSKGITSALRDALALLPFRCAPLSLSAPFNCFLFFRFFFWGCGCVGCGGLGWCGSLWVGFVAVLFRVLLFFFCFCCGFFFSSSCFRCSCPFGRSFFRFLWLAFGCSSSFGLGFRCGFRSCCRFGFVWLCWWFVWACSRFVSCCFGFPRFFLRLRSWCVRGSFRCVGAFRCRFAFARLGFLSCGRVSCWACSFFAPCCLFLWVGFGFVGFACVRLRFGGSCVGLASAPFLSSCFVGVCFLWLWLVFPPLVQ